jgi:hypothetical protein
MLCFPKLGKDWLLPIPEVPVDCLQKPMARAVAVPGRKAYQQREEPAIEED